MDYGPGGHANTACDKSGTSAMVEQSPLVERSVKHPKVSVVIVNWNGREVLRECLAAVCAQCYPNFHVIVVDNGSTDGSVACVREQFPEVEVLELGDNRGFAGGNNAGIQKALADAEVEYVALLNNDATAADCWLKELVNQAEKNARAGMVASKLLYADGRNTINSVGTTILKDGFATHLGGKEVDRGQYDNVEQVFAPCAAAALYRRAMLEEVGLFDEDFFAYCEDVDLAWRARLMGWDCVLSPKALVYHVRSVTSRGYSEFKLFQIERNRLWVLVKNYPLRNLMLSPLYTLYRLLLMYRASAHRGTEVSEYSENIPLHRIAFVLLKAWMSATMDIFGLLKKRRRIQSSKRVSPHQIAQWFDQYSAPMREVVRR